MTTNEIIETGTLMGLGFNKDSNHQSLLNKGTVVFDGANGQRFLFETSWSKKKVYKKFGESLINMGKRLKRMEIYDCIFPLKDDEDFE